MVHDAAERATLYDPDKAVQRLGADNPENPAVVELAGVYHNLLRRWADT